MTEYGIDLNWTQHNSPSYSSAPVAQSQTPEDMAVPFTTYTVGAPGTAIFSGFVRDLGEFNPKLDGRTAFPTYEKMRRSDADVKAALLACKLPIRAAEKQILPGVGSNDPQYKRAKEIAEFVKNNLFGGLESETITGVKYSQGFEQVEENALLALDFGCAAHEDLWTIDGEWVRLRRCAPRLPLTFYRFWTEDDGETMLALEQYGYRKNQFVNVVVPAEKICYFTHEKEGSNFYGRSILRAAYQHYYIKSQLYRIDAIALERNGLGVPTFTMPEGYSVEDKNTARAWATQLVAHESTGVALPPGWKFEITGIKGRLRDPWNSIRHQSEMIVKSVLAMFLNLGTTTTGSRALGSAMSDFFMLSLQATARNLAASINEGTIRRLVDYNFDRIGGKPIPYPKLVYADIVVLNPIEMASAIKDLANAQVDVMQPDDELENTLRRRFGLSLKGPIRPRWLPIQTRVMESPLPGETPTSMERGYQTPGPEGEAVQPSALGKTESKTEEGEVANLEQSNVQRSPEDKPNLSKTNTPLKSTVTPLNPTGKKSGRGDVLMPDTKSKVDMSETGIGIGGTVYKLLLSSANGRTVCVDFDGVLSVHESGAHKDVAGPVIPQGKQLVLDLARKGYRVVILTARLNLDLVRHFLIENEIPFADVTNIKPPAVAYIDDKAVFFAPEKAEKVVRKVAKLDKKGQKRDRDRKKAR